MGTREAVAQWLRLRRSVINSPWLCIHCTPLSPHPHQPCQFCRPVSAGKPQPVTPSSPGWVCSRPRRRGEHAPPPLLLGPWVPHPWGWPRPECLDPVFQDILGGPLGKVQGNGVNGPGRLQTLNSAWLEQRVRPFGLSAGPLEQRHPGLGPVWPGVVPRLSSCPWSPAGATGWKAGPALLLRATVLVPTLTPTSAGQLCIVPQNEVPT